MKIRYKSLSPVNYAVLLSYATKTPYQKYILAPHFLAPHLLKIFSTKSYKQIFSKAIPYTPTRLHNHTLVQSIPISIQCPTEYQLLYTSKFFSTSPKVLPELI